jgi:hypothetical protein
LRVWTKQYFSSNSKKVSFSETEKLPICLNISKILELNDPFLVRVLLHCYNFKYDSYVAEALAFFQSSENSQNKAWLHYAIYAGVQDKELAKNWKKPVKFIEAVRLLFFDYSHWPKDKIARYSLMRQLVCTSELSEADYHVLKRIYDLGITGLKSLTQINSLTSEEEGQIKNYLSSSAVGNMLSLGYTIRDSKDAINYHKVVTDFASVNLKRMEVEQQQALTKLHMAKLNQELNLDVGFTLRSHTEIPIFHRVKSRTLGLKATYNQDIIKKRDLL